MRTPRVKVTIVIRVAAFFAVVGAAFAFIAVKTLLNSVPGGETMGVIDIVIALALFSIAGYYLWALRYLKKRPELIRKVDPEYEDRKGGA